MPSNSPDKDLAADIHFALSRFEYRKPPRFNIDDPDAAAKYHRRVAELVVEQLKLSWRFELRPPSQFLIGGGDKSD